MVRDFIQHNFWLKLFALVLALLTWFTIRFAIQHNIGLGQTILSSEEVTREFRHLPLSALTGLSDERRYNISPQEVTVTLKGHPALIRQIIPRDIEVFVNLFDSPSAGKEYRRIEVIPPTGTSLLRVVPPVVQIESGPPNQKG